MGITTKLKPFYRMGKYSRRAVGRPWRSPKVALEALHLKDAGLSDVEIAARFGWAVQEDNYGNKRLSTTVRRYLKRAREIQSELDRNKDIHRVPPERKETQRPWWRRVYRGRIVLPSGYRCHFQFGLQLALDAERKFIGVRPCPESKLKLDGKGGLTIPRTLRNEASLGDAALIVGSSDEYFEIWNLQSWEEERART